MYFFLPFGSNTIFYTGPSEERISNLTCEKAHNSEIFIRINEITYFNNRFDYLRERNATKYRDININQYRYKYQFDKTEGGSRFPINYDYDYKITAECTEDSPFRDGKCYKYSLDRITLILTVPRRDYRNTTFDLQCSIFEGNNEDFDKLQINTDNRIKELEDRYKKDKERTKTEERKERQI
jgi:hypothetical protein